MTDTDYSKRGSLFYYEKQVVSKHLFFLWYCLFWSLFGLTSFSLDLQDQSKLSHNSVYHIIRSWKYWSKISNKETLFTLIFLLIHQILFKLNGLSWCCTTVNKKIWLANWKTKRMIWVLEDQIFRWFCRNKLWWCFF